MTTSTPAETPGNIALLGAFERDNFGDILFLQLTRDLLNSGSITATAPFGALGDYRPLGMDVSSLANTLAQEPFDCVWVVGGEVGGTSMQAAYRMASGEQQYANYSSLPRRDQEAELARSSSRSPFGSPYLPRMSASENSMHTRLVINSVGLSGLGGLFGLRAEEAWASVREADYISVRDKASASVLSSKGVKHELAPDLVHTLRQLKSQWLERSPRLRPLALIQVKEASLAAHGTANLAHRIVSAESLRPYDIELFVAGAARGHDSVDLYNEVIENVHQLDPERHISISTAESPMEKAELIATCDLWIGTSLHGWIISSSFEVPRVGLELIKLQRYAESWNDPMPAGIPLDQLNYYVNEALKTEETPGRADDLSMMAMTSFRSGALTAAKGPVSDAAAEQRKKEAKRLQRSESSIVRRLVTKGAETARAWRHR